MNAIGSICACGRVMYHAGPVCARCLGRPKIQPYDWFGFWLKVGMVFCALSASAAFFVVCFPPPI